MYQGNNPTAIRSQKCFKQALLSLLNSKPFVKITIKDICEEANLSRQTFYQFFATKEDVIRFSIKDLLKEFESEIKNLNTIGHWEVSSHFFRFFRKNADFINLLLANRLAYLLMEELAMEIENVFKMVSRVSGNQETMYSSIFLAGALSHTLLYWLNDDNRMSEEELSKLIYNIVHGKYFKESEKKLEMK